MASIAVIEEYCLRIGASIMEGKARPHVAVVGAGRIGSVHARNLTTLGAKITLVEPDPRRRDVIASEFDTIVPAVSEISHIDGVIVATPTDTHVAVVEEVLHLGVPILVEKPMAADPLASARLGELADWHGIPLRIAFQRRQSPEFLALKRAYLESGKGISLATFVSLDGAAPPTGYQVAGGSMAFDLQIHDIDIMLWLFESPAIEVTSNQVPSPESPDLLLTHARLLNGVLCSLVSKRVSPFGCQVHAELIGDECVLDTRQLVPPKYHADFQSRFAHAYLRQSELFLRLIDGEDRLPSWTDAVAAEDISRRISESYLQKSRTLCKEP